MVGDRRGACQPSGSSDFLAEVLLEHRLDARRGGAALDPGDHLLCPDEHERWCSRDAQLLRDVAPFVHVDLHDAQTVALLARDMREEALHPPGGTRAGRGEEEEDDARFVRQEVRSLFPLLYDAKHAAATRVTRRWALGTRSGSWSDSGRRSGS